MKYTLRYNFADQEPVEVTTSLKDIVAWERRYKNKASNLANGIGFPEDLRAPNAGGAALPNDANNKRILNGKTYFNIGGNWYTPQ